MTNKHININQHQLAFNLETVQTQHKEVQNQPKTTPILTQNQPKTNPKQTQNRPNPAEKWTAELKNTIKMISPISPSNFPKTDLKLHQNWPKTSPKLTLNFPSYMHCTNAFWGRCCAGGAAACYEWQLQKLRVLLGNSQEQCQCTMCIIGTVKLYSETWQFGNSLNNIQLENELTLLIKQYWTILNNMNSQPVYKQYLDSFSWLGWLGCRCESALNYSGSARDLLVPSRCAIGTRPSRCVPGCGEGTTVECLWMPVIQSLIVHW